jgi:proteasome lid subunit RPN8/RPN11
MPTRAAGEFATWRVEGKSPVIRYSLQVLEEIRAAAVEGYRSLPRTGMEIGGVLFGYREGGVVNVVAGRPLECEHAMGPAFVLSKRDEAALNALVVEARRDPTLGLARPVGWYHSHTRSDIMLSDEDLEIFDRHFPERWQVALVVRPQKFGPCQAGFFIREPDGSVRAEASYREFTLEPYEPAAAKPVRQPEEAAARPALAPAPEARSAGGAAWKWAFLVLLMLLTGAAAAVAGNSYVHFGPPPPAAIALRAIDVNGQLVIQWDRLSNAVRGADTAALRIADAGGKSTIPLDWEHLAAGSATYMRQSGAVEVRMITYARGRELAREAVSFTGPPPSAAAQTAELIRQREEAIRERDAALKDAGGLRAQLRAAAEKRGELEDAVKALQRRLAVEAGLRRR